MVHRQKKAGEVEALTGFESGHAGFADLPDGVTSLVMASSQDREVLLGRLLAAG